jgi:SAM-dependent methyltransferase
VKRCLACEARFESSGWRCPECGWEPPAGPELRFAEGDPSFPDDSFELLRGLEDRSFWFRARNDLIVWALRSHFASARSLFEVGCGTGFVLAALRERCPRLRLAGGELSRAGLDVARSRLPDVPLLQVDARRLPFEAEYDVVAAFDVLEHVREDETVLRELARAATPRGGVLLTVPQHPFLWSDADTFGGHERRYTRRELVAKLERAGLRVEHVTSFVTLLLPVVAGSRLVQRWRSKPFDPADEFALPRAVDGLFERVMTLERRLIARGISLPAGSSLLAVATRP